MAKKNIKKETDSIEVIANSDRHDRAICSSVNTQYVVQNLHLNHNSIEDLIYTIRGLHVMIDSDLATIYEVETKNLKRSVKANIDRFPEDFMFVLTKEEMAARSFIRIWLRCEMLESSISFGCLSGLRSGLGNIQKA